MAIFCDDQPSINRERYDIVNVIKTLDRPLYVAAPMVRYSKLAFRALVRHYGCELCFTPMLYADCFVKSEQARMADFSTEPSDYPLITQFAADSADNFVQAANLVSRKTLDAACGSALMKRPEHLMQMLSESRRRIADKDFSLSAKIRIFSNVRRTVDFCQHLERTGIDFLVVHGRTPSQRHEAVDIEIFKEIKESVKIPVIANGDAKSLDDVHFYGRQTGVDGVMIARGLLSNPALFTGTQSGRVGCVERWIDMVDKYEIPFTLFHRHLSFMTEKFLNKEGRSRLAVTNCVVDAAAVVEESMGVDSRAIVSRMNNLLLSQH